MSEQMNRMRDGAGFIAALDQSGGSTPRALEAYGIGPEAWSTDEEMFDLVHAMRTRVMTSPAFTSERILAAILFERTRPSRAVPRPTTCGRSRASSPSSRWTRALRPRPMAPAS